MILSLPRVKDSNVGVRVNLDLLWLTAENLWNLCHNLLSVNGDVRSLNTVSSRINKCISTGIEMTIIWWWTAVSWGVHVILGHHWYSVTYWGFWVILETAKTGGLWFYVLWFSAPKKNQPYWGIGNFFLFEGWCVELGGFELPTIFNGFRNPFKHSAFTPLYAQQYFSSLCTASLGSSSYVICGFVVRHGV